MKKRNVLLYQGFISLIPVFIYSIFMKDMPDIVPIHYNANLEPDNFGSKYLMLTLLFFMSATSIGVSALILNLNSIDPKKKYSENNALIVKISWNLVIFLALIGLLIVLNIVYPETNLLTPKLIIITVALLLASIGNFMNSIKQNYFIGIRTPWNLEDEENWRKTHQLASKIWFLGGSIMAIIITITPIKYSVWVILIGVVPMILVPYWYSYKIFVKGNKN
jgi:uncharacterized membrane protein